jgi:hypothetical protein
MFSSPYLKPQDIPHGRLPGAIAEFAEEEMNVPRQRKLVMYFRGIEKGLVLNKTNATTLQKAFGDDTDAMIGRVIELVVKPDSFKGEDILTIRIEVPTDQPPPPPSDVAAKRPIIDDDIPF